MPEIREDATGIIIKPSGMEHVSAGGVDYTETDPTARLVMKELAENWGITESLWARMSQREQVNLTFKALENLQREYDLDPLSWMESMSPAHDADKFDQRYLNFIKTDQA